MSSSSWCVSLEVEESTASHWQQRRGSPVNRLGSSASLPSDSSTTLPSAFCCLATWVHFRFGELGPASPSSSSSSSSLEKLCWRYNNKIFIKEQDSLWYMWSFLITFLIFNFMKCMTQPLMKDLSCDYPSPPHYNVGLFCCVCVFVRVRVHARAHACVYTYMR